MIAEISFYSLSSSRPHGDANKRPGEQRTRFEDFGEDGDPIDLLEDTEQDNRWGREDPEIKYPKTAN